MKSPSEGPLAYAIVDPSGDQEAQVSIVQAADFLSFLSVTAVCVIRCAPVPSAFITISAVSTARLSDHLSRRSKTIRAPSGDQDGYSSQAVVSRRRPVPSAFTTQIPRRAQLEWNAASWAAKTSRLPSGDQAEWAIPCGRCARRCAPDPSGATA